MRLIFYKAPLISRLVIFIVLPLFVILGFIYQSVFIDTLPVLNSETTHVDIRDNVTISRDEHGIPVIRAHHDEDVFFAMGYVHAQDRLWQLELQRRLARGTLSEVFGSETIEQDIWYRTLDLYTSAENSIRHLSPDVRNSLEQYAAGINTFLRESHALPVEFSVLGVEPEPWTIVDSLVWSKIFALNLGGNYRQEIQRYLASQYLSASQFNFLFSKEAPEKNTAKQYAENTVFADLLSLNLSQEHEWNVGGKYVGSNAWAVSGKFTDDGMPIIANDPHLGLQLPSLWYGVKQVGKNINSTGMSLVGMPLVIFGRNERISWAGTNMMADVQDIVIEQLHPGNAALYKSGEQWLPFESKQEYIHVKPDFPDALRMPYKPVEVVVRKSKNGPIISDVVKGARGAYSLKWTALSIADTSYEFFYRVNYAQNWQEFKSSLKFHVAPAINIIYADVENNIALVGAGKIPIRRQGKGYLPTIGGEKEDQWQGYVPALSMPIDLNPPAGFVVNANNANADATYPYFISNDFAQEFRAKRISDLLEQKISSQTYVDIKDMQQIQADLLDLSQTQLREFLVKSEGQSATEKQALQHLMSWDGRASMSSTGATVYYTWLRHLKRLIFADELRGSWNLTDENRQLMSIVNGISSKKLVEVLKGASQWCDDVTTETAEGCEFQLQKGLSLTVKELIKLAGNAVVDWQWGNVQFTEYRHQPFSQNKFLGQFFERKIGNGGAPNTVNVAVSSFDESLGYRQFFGAGFRQIFQLSTGTDASVFMNSTGQSGQVSSDYYDDMVEAFRDVTFFNFPNAEHQHNVIHLKPMLNKEG